MASLTHIILAAGRSQRMGATNKLLLPVKGVPMLGRVIEAVQAADPYYCVVVTGYEDRAIREALAGYPVRIAYNPEFEAGVSTSIRRGIIAAPDASEGFLFCLGDMPFVRPETFRAVGEAFAQRGGIVAAGHEGRQGHPVVFHTDFRDALLALQGDQGGRQIIEAHPEAVAVVDVNDPGIFADVDTLESYEAYCRNPDFS